ncbi:MAG: RNA polymerase sigma factor [Solirubrobacteraceae bacterium]
MKRGPVEEVGLDYPVESGVLELLTFEQCADVVAGEGDRDPGDGMCDEFGGEHEISVLNEEVVRVLKVRAKRAVTTGLLMLAPEQRALLVLHELEGLSYAQVAQVLEIAPAAVKGRMHRARVALATVVGGDW